MISERRGGLLYGGQVAIMYSYAKKENKILLNQTLILRKKHDNNNIRKFTVCKSCSLLLIVQEHILKRKNKKNRLQGNCGGSHTSMRHM